MTDRLHLFLLLLTLLDLGFVHATGAVTDLWLTPLWLMTVAAPWLRRLQRHRAYRVVWNGGVLVVFASLVHHATTTGLLHMLEDGLVLAVLCQVHLLNNVGERQRPDLTFFNSFLIAFVTSFFAPDLTWSLLFVAHSFVLVPALQLYAFTRGTRAVDGSTVRRLVHDGIGRTAFVGVVTAAVFVLWPRDFQRRGWLGESLRFAEQLEAGMTDRIEIERDTKVALDDAVIAKITPLEGGLDTVPMHWRALAFARFDGRTWYPQDAGELGSRFATDPPWHRDAEGAWRRPARGAPRAVVRVQLLDGSARQLLSPLAATAMTVEAGPGLVLDPRSHGGFSLVRVDGSSGGPLDYTVDVAMPVPAPDVTLRTRAHFTMLPEQGVPKLAYDLGEQLRRALPKDAEALALATAASEWLEQNRRYQLPGEPGFAQNLGEFLLGTAAGHCEYFATALALVLRAQGVPCRLVGGYLAHERSADGSAIVARARDAHAWVEVLAADGSWHTFDATPAADVLRSAAQDAGWWRRTTEELAALWAAVTGFDAESRQRWLEALAHAPVRHPFATAFVVLAGIALVRLRRRTGTRPQVVVDLERTIRKARLPMLPGETPRELVARAAARGVDAPLLAAMRLAAERHERARYGAGGAL